MSVVKQSRSNCRGVSLAINTVSEPVASRVSSKNPVRVGTVTLRQLDNAIAGEIRRNDLVRGTDRGWKEHALVIIDRLSL